MVRTQIQLNEKQAEGLKKMAAFRHLSVAELIRQAVDEMLKANRAIDSGERKKRALEIAGRFRSGKRDISREHDKYFAEAAGK